MTSGLGERGPPRVSSGDRSSPASLAPSNVHPSRDCRLLRHSQLPGLLFPAALLYPIFAQPDHAVPPLPPAAACPPPSVLHLCSPRSRPCPTPPLRLIHSHHRLPVIDDPLRQGLAVAIWDCRPARGEARVRLGSSQVSASRGQSGLQPATDPLDLLHGDQVLTSRIL